MLSEDLPFGSLRKILEELRCRFLTSNNSLAPSGLPHAQLDKKKALLGGVFSDIDLRRSVVDLSRRVGKTDQGSFNHFFEQVFAF